MVKDLYHVFDQKNLKAKPFVAAYVDKYPFHSTSLPSIPPRIWNPILS